MTINEMKKLVNEKITEEDREGFKDEIGMDVEEFFDLCESNPLFQMIAEAYLTVELEDYVD